MLKLNLLGSHSVKPGLPISIAVLAVATMLGCGHRTQPGPTIAAQPVSVQPVLGTWTGTQTGIVDKNGNPFQFVAQFNGSGAFTLSGNWQGVSGPGGQDMAGTYTQNGSHVTLNATVNTSRVGGQSLKMNGLSLNGTISPDGKSIHIEHTIMMDYVLTRS